MLISVIFQNMHQVWADKNTVFWNFREPEILSVKEM